MRRYPAVAVIGAAMLVIAALWVATGAFAARTRPDLGGLVTVPRLANAPMRTPFPPTPEPTSTPAPGTPTSTPATSATTRDGSGARQVVPAPDCPAGQTADPDEEDPDDRCDD